MNVINELFSGSLLHILSFWPYIFGIVGLLIAFKFLRGRLNVNTFVLRITRTILLLPVFFLKVLVWLTRRVKFIERQFNRVLKFLSRLDKPIQQRLDAYFRSKLGLLRGSEADLLTHMQTLVPNDKHPIWEDLHGVPADLRRSFVEDGRLTVPREVLQFYPLNHHDLLVGVKAALLAFMVSLAMLTFTAFFIPSTLPERLNAVNQMQVNFEPSLDQFDAWVSADESGRNSARQATVTRMKNQHYTIVTFWLAPFAILAWLVLIIWGALAISAVVLRSYLLEKVTEWNRAKPLNLILPDQYSKEAVVRFKYRIEDRNRERQAYEKQLSAIRTYDRTPTLKLGYATGDFRFRGHIASPHRGQEMRISLNDLHQNMIILGGTGAGKTRNVIKPILSQLMDLRITEASKPNGMQVSFFNTDSKGVLHVEVRTLAEEKGIAHDLMVIGCNSETEYAIDLLDGLSPQQVADIIKSVAAQSGAGGDDFWQDLAANTILNFAILAFAVSRLRLKVDAERSDGVNPYSLLFIYDAILSKEVASALSNEAIDGMQDLDSNVVDVDQIQGAVLYVETQWINLVPETKAGILANVTRLLGGFKSGDLRIRDAFARGNSPRQLRVQDFWGKLISVNLPVQVYGLPATLVNVFIKSRLFMHAIRRQAENETRRKVIEDEALRLAFDPLFEGWPMLELPVSKLEQEVNVEIAMSIDQRLLIENYKTAGKRLVEEALRLPLIELRADEWYREDEPVSDAASVERLCSLIPDLTEKERARIIPLATEWELALESLQEAKIPEMRRRATLAEIAKNSSLMEVAETSIRSLVEEWESLNFELERNKLYFVADEYQDLITVGGGSVPNDSTFWNVARSTGTTGIIATQSVSSLEKKIDSSGDGKQTLNFLANMRTKIILQVEDPKTMQYIQSTLTGKTTRFLAFDKDHFESYEAFLREFNQLDPFVFFDYLDFARHLDRVSKVKDELSLEAIDSALNLPRVKSMLSSPEAADYIAMGIYDLTGRHSVDVDTRFIDRRRYTTSSSSGAGGGSVTRSDNLANMLATEQQATWRAEDKYKTYMSEGNLTEQMDSFNERDMLSLGQTHAFMSVIRAGRMRQDIVEIGTD